MTRFRAGYALYLLAFVFFALAVVFSGSVPVGSSLLATGWISAGTGVWLMRFK